MLLPKCFICDTKSIIYCENVYTLRTCHTDTPVMEILKKFAEELDITIGQQTRKSTDPIICQMCMIKINEYDLACMTAKAMESQLKDLLQRKKEFHDSKSDADYNPDDPAFSDEEEEEKNYGAVSNGTVVTVMRCNVCEINFKR